VSDTKYLVFRTYMENERPDISSPEERIVLYGWTSNKNILKAFFSQRNKDKYRVKKVSTEDLAYYYSDTDLSMDIMIDFLTLKIASTGEEIEFFITKHEMMETEKKIQAYFRNLSSIVDRGKCGIKHLNMFNNLDEYYADALLYLGFEPPEIEALYDVCGYHECTSSEDMINMEIEGAYSMYDYPEEEYHRKDEIPGLSTFTLPAKKILYSLESFIMILREDL